MVKFLIEKGYLINRTDKTYSPLNEALSQNNINIVLLLLENGEILDSFHVYKLSINDISIIHEHFTKKMLDTNIKIKDRYKIIKLYNKICNTIEDNIKKEII